MVTTKKTTEPKQEKQETKAEVKPVVKAPAKKPAPAKKAEAKPEVKAEAKKVDVPKAESKKEEGPIVRVADLQCDMEDLCDMIESLEAPMAMVHDILESIDSGNGIAVRSQHIRNMMLAMLSACSDGTRQIFHHVQAMRRKIIDADELVLGPKSLELESAEDEEM